MKVTVLMENGGPDHLICEHGLSLHLAYEGRSCLLDGGSSGRFTKNAAALGVDLETVEAAFLSHGHWDHGDGLAAFLDRNQTAKVYARPGILEPQYDGADYIGVAQSILAGYRDRFDLANGPREILPGLHLIPDSVSHEQSLVAETADGLVVMNSCCHAGVATIVADILERFPGKGVRAVLGGFHLMGGRDPSTLGMAPEVVTALAHRLCGELDVGGIYTGHCTGAPGFALLAQEYPSRIHPLHTGDILTF